MKIGGSAITVKSAENGVPRLDIITQVTKEIAIFLSQHPDDHCILVIGPGSFAHGLAKKHKLHLGFNKENAHGVVETHNGVVALQKIVVASLNAQGVNALPVHTMHCAVCTNKRISFFNTDMIKIMLKHNFVPVLSGDMATDTELGFCILSGDQITPFLANTLHLSSVGLASCEDGVYDSNGVVIPEISNDTFATFQSAIGQSQGIDVTGGMLGKVRELLKPGAPATSYIFNATKKGNILAFLEGKALGTAIINTKHSTNQTKP